MLWFSWLYPQASAARSARLFCTFGASVFPVFVGNCFLGSHHIFSRNCVHEHHEAVPPPLLLLQRTGLSTRRCRSSLRCFVIKKLSLRAEILEIFHSKCSTIGRERRYNWREKFSQPKERFHLEGHSTSISVHNNMPDCSFHDINLRRLRCYTHTSEPIDAASSHRQ